MIQTFDPSNAVLKMVENHDYRALYDQQIAERELFHYPPFYRIIRLTMKDHNGVKIHAAATELQTYLARVFGRRVSAVIIPSVERVQAYYIRELTLRIEQGANITEAKRRLKEAIDHVWSNKKYSTSKIIIDVDC